jgi:hypothetical protein
MRRIETAEMCFLIEVAGYRMPGHRCCEDIAETGNGRSQYNTKGYHKKWLQRL